MGKGSQRRPLGNVDRAKCDRAYGDAHERIFGKRKRKKVQLSDAAVLRQLD